METVTDFIFLDFKVTVGGDCSCQKTLASWKKSYNNPRYILRSRDITLLTKVRTIRAIVFPVSDTDVRVGP